MIKYFYIALFTFAILGFVGESLAQGVTIPKGTPITLNNYADLLQSIDNFMIFAGTLMAVIFLVWAGIEYVTAGADQKKVTDAKQRLKVGLIGSLIIFGVGTIIMTLQLIGGGDINAIFR